MRPRPSRATVTAGPLSTQGTGRAPGTRHAAQGAQFPARPHHRPLRKLAPQRPPGRQGRGHLPLATTPPQGKHAAAGDSADFGFLQTPLGAPIRCLSEEEDERARATHTHGPRSACRELSTRCHTAPAPSGQFWESRPTASLDWKCSGAAS